MVFAFAPIVGLLLGLSSITVPWTTLFLSVVLYIVVPVIAAQLWRRSLLMRGGDRTLAQTLRRLQPISLVALLATLVLLFGFQGEEIARQLLIIALLAVPNRALGVPHNVACPSAPQISSSRRLRRRSRSLAFSRALRSQPWSTSSSRCRLWCLSSRSYSEHAGGTNMRGPSIGVCRIFDVRENQIEDARRRDRRCSAACDRCGNRGYEPVAFTVPCRLRPCYAGIGELSVYVAREYRGRGAGRPVLGALIEGATLPVRRL